MPATLQAALKSLEFFAQWSNYLLVTTVAALGWVSTQVDLRSIKWKNWCIASLATSVLFGILTLSLVPILANQLTVSPAAAGSAASFYELRAPFRSLWLWGPIIRVPVKLVCWPQHVLFVVGILLYATGRPKKAAA